MRSYYEIVDFKNEHLSVYKECFGDSLWSKYYGFGSENFDLDEYIRTSVLKNYSTVKRLILLNSRKQPILFTHICTENDNSVIVGGLLPRLLNSGQGVVCSLVVFDYVFTYTKTKCITVSILKENTRSLNMIRKLGFSEIQSNSDENKSKFLLQLKKEDYPNCFSKLLLHRIEYAKK